MPLKPSHTETRTHTETRASRTLPSTTGVTLKDSRPDPSAPTCLCAMPEAQQRGSLPWDFAVLSQNTHPPLPQSLPESRQRDGQTDRTPKSRQRDGQTDRTPFDATTSSAASREERWEAQRPSCNLKPKPSNCLNTQNFRILIFFLQKANQKEVFFSNKATPKEKPKLRALFCFYSED